MVLERLANGVTFPNIGFQVNTLLSSIDRSEHRLVEIAPIIVELEVILSKRDFTQVRVWKISLLPIALALCRNNLEDDDSDRFQGNQQTMLPPGGFAAQRSDAVDVWNSTGQ